MLRAAGNSRSGSAVITPSVSDQISTSSAPRAAPSNVAVRSLPLRAHGRDLTGRRAANEPTGQRGRRLRERAAQIRRSRHLRPSSAIGRVAPKLTSVTKPRSQTSIAIVFETTVSEEVGDRARAHPLAEATDVVEAARAQLAHEGRSRGAGPSSPRKKRREHRAVAAELRRDRHLPVEQRPHRARSARPRPHAPRGRGRSGIPLCAEHTTSGSQRGAPRNDGEDLLDLRPVRAPVGRPPNFITTIMACTCEDSAARRPVSSESFAAEQAPRLA